MSVSALGYPVQMMCVNPVKSTKNHLELQEIYCIAVGYPVDETLLSLDIKWGSPLHSMSSF